MTRRYRRISESVAVGTAIVIGMFLAGSGVTAAAQTIETIRDEFRTISYQGNDGTSDFSGPWMERGENDGPTSGSIRVVADDRCAGGIGSCLYLGSDGGDLDSFSVDRTANLTGATTVTLRFTWRRKSQGQVNGTVRIRVSGNGGTSWSTLRTIAIAGSQRSSSEALDITAWAGSSTVIRFEGMGTDVTGFLAIDDVELSASLATTSTATTTTLSTTSTTVPGTTTTSTTNGSGTTTSLPGTTTTPDSTTSAGSPEAGTRSVTTVPHGSIQPDSGIPSTARGDRDAESSDPDTPIEASEEFAGENPADQERGSASPAMLVSAQVLALLLVGGSLVGVGVDRGGRRNER